MRVRAFFGGIIATSTIASTPSEAAPAETAPQKVIARIDLSKPFHLPPGARFTAMQGPDVQDPNGDPGDRINGSVYLCVRLTHSAPCAPDLNGALGYDTDRSPYGHYLQVARIVYPQGTSRPPLLHLQVASLPGFNGSQGHATIIVAFNRATHRFERVYNEVFGGNMNQGVRFVASGPLRGDIISAEPTWNAPYGYWIAVNKLTPSYHYRKVLRYRSATHYNDGNRLAVIDSEMPNILRRLGVWHPGDPLPLPKAGCAHPRLVKTELWCS